MTPDQRQRLAEYALDGILRGGDMRTTLAEMSDEPYEASQLCVCSEAEVTAWADEVLLMVGRYGARGMPPRSL